MAQAMGFETVGIDPTEALIEVARARDREGDYRQEPAEALSLESAAFDVVLSYLTLCDIGEFEIAIKEMARVAKPGGKIIAVNVNTAMGVGTGWVKDVTGKKLHWPLDGYAFESGMRVAWCGIEIVNYHRPLSMYVQAFLSEGLRLTNFQEPIPSPQAMLDYPGLRDSLRLPNFWVMTWQKP